MIKQLSRDEIRERIIKELKVATERKIIVSALHEITKRRLIYVADYIEKHLFSNTEEPAPTYKKVADAFATTTDNIETYFLREKKKQLFDRVICEKDEMPTFTQSRVFIIPHAYKISVAKTQDVIHLKKPKLSQCVVHIEQKPKPITYKYFVGREKELKTIKTLLEADLPKIIVVHGMPGIGKKTVVSKLIDDIYAESPDYYNLFWYQFTKGGSFHGFLESIRSFFEEIGEDKLTPYISFSKREAELSVCAGIIRNVLEKCRTVVVLEAVHLAQQNCANLLASLVDQRVPIGESNIIVISDRVRTFYGPDDVFAHRTIQELKIGELSREECKKIIEAKVGRVDDLAVDKLYKTSKGVPLFFMIAENIMEKKGAEKVKEVEAEFLGRELLPILSEEEKTFMNRLSVFREGEDVPQQILFKKEIDEKLINNLLGMSLVEETEHDHYRLHPIIKRVFYEKLIYPDRAKYHAYAADYYKLKDDIHSIKENVYHLTQAKDAEGVVKLITKHYHALIWDGDIEFLKSTLKAVDTEKIPKKWLDNYYRNCADLLILGEEFEGAKDVLRKNMHVLHELQNGIGCEPYDDKEGFAETYRNLGYIYWRTGQWEKVEEHLMKGKKIYEELNDTLKIADILVNLGNLYANQGRIREAMKDYEDALKKLRIIETSMDPEKITDAKAEIGRIYRNRSELYNNIGEYSKAINDAGKALEILEGVGTHMMIAHTYTMLASGLVEKGLIDEAEFECRKAKEMSKHYVDRYGVSLTNRIFGIIYRDKKDLKSSEEYFQKSLLFLKEKGEEKECAGILFDRGVTLYELGITYKDMGDNKKAEKTFQQALDILENMGAKLFSGRTMLELGKMYRDQGDRKKARKNLRMALSIFEELNIPVFIKKTEKELSTCEVSIIDKIKSKISQS